MNDFEVLFNPSFQISNGRRYFAIRAKKKLSEGDIRSYLVAEVDNQKLQVVDLSEYCAGFGISRVADPKLLLLRGEVWCTFNTGFVASGRNEIYLMKVDGELGAPKLVSYHGRSRIEKNWAFFVHDDELFCLYGLSSVKVLKCNDSAADILTFSLHIDRKFQAFKKYTIGTQFAEVGDTLFFVAHRKVQLFKKRLYLGRVFSMTKMDGCVVPRSSFLLHSFRDAFGSPVRFNKNLFSCTYFSGILVDNKSLRLGYGVNDVKYSICEVKLDSIWN